MFKIIPAIDLKDGKCVQLIGGDPSKEIISIEDPISIAKMWIEKGAKMLHIVDLDGALKGNIKNFEIIKRISTFPIRIQAGGGIRSIENVSNMLKYVDRVIIGTLAIRNPSITKTLVEKFGEDRIVISLDSKDGKVMMEGWQSKSRLGPDMFVKQFEDIGIRRFFYTNINMEGRMSGIDIKPIKKILESIKNKDTSLIVSGGISSIEDVSSLKKLGIEGVIIGSALYKGVVRLEDLLKLEE
ncbi:MAG: 1-(5-phosphoribosyl)-5-[(5-phosphoribosylamino)methylideneamino] imidazole-4-carboxamide isomerase [Candidatus Methanoliparum thermophilum]|uniref:1-(5-phosphoribosyl)-5-[(5-phosphoribosylamino)methylideneamino] imidazole-4-carboxamide isomerase n=1 Tax=Methanoliparum thermophilum TaxID=2491083 RepID=A0A520KSX8_METT2|nr:1-(5-phosphoribosyl)-5-[(5-phosphoribosylamino)methylideneamino]imidazole-4-carboxamide isomerase [Candidatus Methanoliparum sp. LAM-1]RZN65037.1 MAG: 1-(5-phosphoribosyl)-5-[(5-phosphoribosylamino)methylideneamino] imidazole-4-carboxamide isomerase [Candidatus Methanoliparum thermophilum]BDC36076.1 1-(5-phosphoribosyl)-5-[(5-phosphoribosylamino) methylideneamino] imidazole-4-carboxamide isomerase [Candidatus Methanoliparum sp. LAM-1]